MAEPATLKMKDIETHHLGITAGIPKVVDLPIASLMVLPATFLDQRVGVCERENLRARRGISPIRTA